MIRLRPAVKRVLLICLGLSILVTSIWLWPRIPPEDPIYEGKPLSFWLRIVYAYEHVNPKNASNGQAALKAVKATGTNGEKWLIWAAKYGRRSTPRSPSPSHWKLKVYSWLWLSHKSKVIDPHDQRLAAIFALQMIQRDSNDVSSAMIRLLETQDLGMTEFEMATLHKFQPGSYALLTRAYDRCSPEARRLVIQIFFSSTNFQPAVSQSLASANEHVQQVINVVTKGLKDDNASVRLEALKAVSSNFSGIPKSLLILMKPRPDEVLLNSVLPDLKVLLEDPSPEVREGVREVMRTAYKLHPKP